MVMNTDVCMQLYTHTPGRRWFNFDTYLASPARKPGCKYFAFSEKTLFGSHITGKHVTCKYCLNRFYICTAGVQCVSYCKHKYGD